MRDWVAEGISPVGRGDTDEWALLVKYHIIPVISSAARTLRLTEPLSLRRF